MSVDEVAQARQLANLMGMAGTAERAQNNEEALSYYNRVLEIDPTWSEAWLGKGRAAGMLSTIANPRIGESEVAFVNAIGSSTEEERASLAQRAASDMLPICLIVYRAAKAHVDEFGNSGTARASYMSAGAAALDGLHAAESWDPQNRGIWEAVEAITTDLLNLGGSPDYLAALRTRRDAAIAQLKAIDPQYVPGHVFNVSTMQKEADKADWDQLGYIVLFIVVLAGAVITAIARSR